ncbi:MAG: hypothetical protein ABI844_06705 [Saprospiraceae bacterium]
MKKSFLFLSLLLLAMAGISQSDAKALEVVQKSIDACGGKDKMAAITSMSRKMEINMPFGTSESESYHKNGKYYTKSTMNGNVNFEQKYDGNRAYVGGMQGNQILDDEKSVKRVAQQGKISPIMDLLGSDINLKYAGTEKIDGKMCDKITSKGEDGNEATMFFNTDSKYLMRTITKGEMQGNAFEMTIDFDDYKPIEGILFAHTMKMNTGQFQMEMKVKEIKLNPDIPDSMFLIQ